MNTDEPDELMAVLLGRQAPDEEEDGPAAARYAAAARDMTVLGEQLHLIGDRLAAPEALPGAHTPARPRWIRKGPLALAASVVIAACLAGTGILWSVAQPSGEHGDAKLTEEGLMACARVVADGTVSRRERVGGLVRVVLTVDRYLKPDQGPRETSFLVTGEEEDYFRPGRPMVVIVSRFPGEGVESFTGEDRATAWQWMSAALPASRTLDCTDPG
ncbi:hypothetical protein OG230_12060 [Streptomyces sp. NBC_00234]|uniref:hypothetical protein n=1 Tax=Streptomyces sp. NBC_00234 TaxID=2903638 RepID=UPI002E295128|nr:hypothetical protein [Streptomyces sp. NBC_00234]